MKEKLKKALSAFLIIAVGKEILIFLWARLMGLILGNSFNVSETGELSIRLGITIVLSAAVIIFFCAPTSKNTEPTKPEEPSGRTEEPVS
jgi:hypothetical protein